MKYLQMIRLQTESDGELHVATLNEPEWIGLHAFFDSNGKYPNHSLRPSSDELLGGADMILVRDTMSRRSLPLWGDAEGIVEAVESGCLLQVLLIEIDAADQEEEQLLKVLTNVASALKARQ